MSDLFLLPYLCGQDLVITGGRVYHMTPDPGQESFLKIGRLRLGLSQGPALDDLESNYIIDNREGIRKQLDKQLHRMLAGARGRNHNLTSDDPETLKKEIVFNLMTYYSLADVLRPESENRINERDRKRRSAQKKSLDLAVEEIGKAVRRTGGCLKRAFGKGPLLFLKGSAYDLELIRPSDRGRAALAELNIGRRRYRVGKNSSGNIEQVLSRFEDLIEKRITQDLQANNAVQRYIRERSRAAPAEIDYTLDEQYSPDTNIGFMKNQRGFFIYAKIPQYCLYERIKKNYFRFPPAKVAVAIGRGGDDFVSMPLVIENYTHPALSDVDAPYQYICFGKFVDDLNIKNKPPLEKTYYLLREGVSMMMNNYKSEPGAYKNMYKEDVIELFRDQLVPEHEVDRRWVTNMETVLSFENHPSRQRREC